MSKYKINILWALAANYNRRRGEILDGTRESTTPSVSWKEGKHSVEDGSTHYDIINFLRTQPMNTASVQTLISSLNISHTDHYLRELEKQQIVVRV